MISDYCFTACPMDLRMPEVTCKWVLEQTREMLHPAAADTSDSL